MHQLLHELEKQLPRDCEQRVRSAKEEYNDLVRARIREELSLNLQERSPLARSSTAIPIRVEPGFLSPHPEFHGGPDRNHAADLIGMWGADIAQLAHSSERVSELLGRLQSYGEEWIEKATRYLPVLEMTAELSRLLQERATAATMLERIFVIQDDILGLYNPQPNGTSDIKLYWAAIGVVAQLLQVTIEDLAAVVLIHELAHGYTHLGKDTDNLAWDTRLMCASGNRPVLEGTAQYYTEIISEYLGDRGKASIHHTYLKLRRQQRGLYRIHDRWMNQFSSEVMRSALVKYRRQEGRELDHFQYLLFEERDRLRAYGRSPHPRTQEDIEVNGLLWDDSSEILNDLLIHETLRESRPQSPEEFLLSIGKEWEIAVDLPIAQKASEWSMDRLPRFKKAIGRQDRGMKGRILEAIMDLMDAPIVPRGDTIKPLTGKFQGMWRYRVGDQRLIYRPDTNKHVITLIDFEPRGSAYED